MVAAIVISILNSTFLILILSRASQSPAVFQIYLSLALFFFLLPIALAWFSFGMAGAVFFAGTGAVFSFLVGWVSATPLFLFFVIDQMALCFLLYLLDQRINTLFGNGKIKMHVLTEIMNRKLHHNRLPYHLSGNCGDRHREPCSA